MLILMLAIAILIILTSLPDIYGKQIERVFAWDPFKRWRRHGPNGT